MNPYQIKQEHAMQQRMAQVTARNFTTYTPAIDVRNKSGNLKVDDDDYEAEVRGIGYTNFAADTVEFPGLHTPVGAESRGHKLLTKMGWRVGEGLGKNNQGIKEPVTVKDESTGLGLGKSEEYDSKTAEVTKTRKLLNIERNETEQEREQREVDGARQDQTKIDVKEMNKSFYCEDCDKQYKTVGEFANHLSSYDHHHRKRLADLQKADRARKGAGFDRVKEKKREWEQMEKRANAAAGPPTVAITASTSNSQENAPIEVLPTENRTAVKFSFGGSKFKGSKK